MIHVAAAKPDKQTKLLWYWRNVLSDGAMTNQFPPRLFHSTKFYDFARTKMLCLIYSFQFIQVDRLIVHMGFQANMFVSS